MFQSTNIHNVTATGCRVWGLGYRCNSSFGSCRGVLHLLDAHHDCDACSSKAQVNPEKGAGTRTPAVKPRLNHTSLYMYICRYDRQE